MKRANVKRLVSAALAIPGALMVYDFAAGTTLAMDLLHPSGEFAVRLMILAMLPGPLVEVLGSSRFLLAWLMIRRNLGVAGFGYALLHLLFYAADMTPAGMIDEIGLPGIWTGWLALALMIPPAAVSFDAAVRKLGTTWRLIQRLVYAAFILSLLHWLLLDWEWLPAAVHLLPLFIAWSLRLRRRLAIAPVRSTP